MYDLPCMIMIFNCGFEIQDSVCNVCHDLTMLSVNINDIAIIIIKNVDYRCITWNLKQLICLKILFLKIEDRYKEHCPNFLFYSRHFSFFYFFCFNVYKMIDSEYSMNIYKFVRKVLEQ